MLANSAKYAPAEAGPITLTVHAEPEDTPTNIFVTVVDYGPGVESADMVRLFNRGFRSASALSQGIAGSGLGLYISSKIIEAHGGTIHATRTEGGGLTIRF